MRHVVKHLIVHILVNSNSMNKMHTENVEEHFKNYSSFYDIMNKLFAMGTSFLIPAFLSLPVSHSFKLRITIGLAVTASSY